MKKKHNNNINAKRFSFILILKNICLINLLSVCSLAMPVNVISWQGYYYEWKMNVYRSTWLVKCLLTLILNIWIKLTCVQHFINYKKYCLKMQYTAWEIQSYAFLKVIICLLKQAYMLKNIIKFEFSVSLNNLYQTETLWRCSLISE